MSSRRDKDGKPKGKQESAAAGMLRLAKQYEIVSHLGSVWALRDGADPISVEGLVSRLSREWSKESGRIPSREVLKSVHENLADPAAPERDLSAELEAMRQERLERLERLHAEIAAEREAMREQEIIEATEGAGGVALRAGAAPEVLRSTPGSSCGERVHPVGATALPRADLTPAR